VRRIHYVHTKYFNPR